MPAYEVRIDTTQSLSQVLEQTVRRCVPEGVGVRAERHFDRRGDVYGAEGLGFGYSPRPDEWRIVLTAGYHRYDFYVAEAELRYAADIEWVIRSRVDAALRDLSAHDDELLRAEQMRVEMMRLGMIPIPKFEVDAGSRCPNPPRDAWTMINEDVD